MRWTACLLLGLALAALLALVLATLFPHVPHLTSIGTGLLASYTLWFVLGPAVGTALLLAAWFRSRLRAWLLLATLALLCSTGAAVVLARMMQVARLNGVAVDLSRALGLRHVSDTGAPDELAVYGRDDRGAPLEVAIYRPARSADRPHPVLLYVHGGGWISGSKVDRSADMRWFADRGWLVISADYVLSTDSEHRWDQAGGEIACALAWLGSHVADYGGDASRLSLFGDSAGGSLVLNAAYQANAGLLASPCGALPRVAAVVALYPVVDPVSFDTNPDPHAGPYARLMAERYFGGPASRYPDRYRQLASLQFVSASAPPTLIIVGDIDSLVPPEPTYRLFEALQTHGVEARLIRVPHGQHAFDVIAGGIGSQLMRGATVQFLAGRR